MLEAIVRYFHFLGIIVLSATSLTQIALLEREMRKDKVLLLVNLGRLNSAAALVTIGAGLTLWLWVGKPSEFYSGNFLFYAKLAVFFAAGIFASIPGGFFRRALRNNESLIHVPATVQRLKRLETIGIVLIPLLAVLMARGFGNG